MKLSSINLLKCPVAGTNLYLSKGAIVSGEEVIEGQLISEDGNSYKIDSGIPIFLNPKHIEGKAAQAIEYYSTNSDVYDEYLPVAFELFNANEDEIRNLLTDLLHLQPGQKVLDLTAGTGKDSQLIAKKLQNGEIWLADITKDMLKIAKSKFIDANISIEYSVITACQMPFLDNYFDALYSFTGLGSFTDVKQAIKEMSRVVKVGGRIVFCEKSVPPWLRDTEYGNILIEANPMFKDEIPLNLLPRESRNVEVRWIMENAFYVISFIVGGNEPQGNFSLELPGPRGGNFITRYFGRLEGVSLETKALAQRARDKSGKSMHKWLDEIIRIAAKKELDK